MGAKVNVPPCFPFSRFSIARVGLCQFKVVQPDSVKISLNQLGISIKKIKFYTPAQKIAEILNAEAFIMVNIESYNNDLTLSAFATSKIVDASICQSVSASRRHSGL